MSALKPASLDALDAASVPRDCRDCMAGLVPRGPYYRGVERPRPWCSGGDVKFGRKSLVRLRDCRASREIIVISKDPAAWRVAPGDVHRG